METNYRLILDQEFQLRKNKNPSYSLRAFSRDVGISVAQMSEVLKNKENLSVKSALSIAKKLHFSSLAEKRFCLLVQLASLKDVNKLTSLRIELEQLEKKIIIPQEVIKVMSDWTHMTILAFKDIHPTLTKISLISEQLGISCEKVEDSLNRLCHVGLLQKVKDGYSTSKRFFETTFEIPSRAIRSIHRQFMQKALDALEQQSIKERSFDTLVFSFEEKDMPQAKEKIRKFCDEFNKAFEGQGENREVYCLGIQFFRISKKNHES